MGKTRPNEKDNNSIKNDNNQPMSADSQSAEGLSSLSYANLLMLNLFPDAFRDNPFPLLHNVTLPVDLNLINLQLAALQLENNKNESETGKQCATSDTEFSENILQSVNIAYIDQQTIPLENATHSFVLNEYTSRGTQITLSETYDDFAFISSTINPTDQLFNLVNFHTATQELGRPNNTDEGEGVGSAVFAPGIGPVGVTTGTSTSEVPLPPANTPPQAGDSSVSGTEDVSYIFSLNDFVFSDSDAGDAVETIKIETLPNNGVLEIYNGSSWDPVSAGDVIALSVILDSHLRFTGGLHESGDDNFVTPGVGLNQQDYASFEFSVSDGTDSSNLATVTIDLAAVVDPLIIGNSEGGLRLYSTNFLADAKLAFNALDGSNMYKVMINHLDGTADLTLLGAISNNAFIDHGQIASNLTGTRVYALETQPTEYGYFDTTTNTFVPISSTAISPANPQVAGLAYYNDHGTEYLYTISITNETVVAYNNINAINAFASPDFSYGPFTIVSSPGGLSNGLIYDFNGGDLVFDEFGQAYAISDTRVPVAGKDGGFAKLNFATNEAYLLNNDTLELVNLTGMIYDPTTHLFYASRSSTVTGTFTEGFIVFNKDGVQVDSIPYIFNGNNFDHTGGDAASTLQVEYSVPVDLTQIDADGSQAFTSITIALNSPVAGAELYHDGILVTDNSTIELVSSNGTVNAHVSISGQTWTLTLDDAGGISIEDNLLSIRTSSSQTADFSATLTAVTTELSTGDSLSDSITFNYEPTKPIIGEGNMSIVHDETSGIDSGTHDVSAVGLPGIFDTLESANSLSDPLGQAHTPQGIFEYYVPFGTGYVSNVSLTQQDGSAFNGVDSGLLSMNNNPILLYQDANDNMVVGRENNLSGDVIFALYLDEGNALYGAANDTLWLAQYQHVLHPDNLDANEAVSIQDLIYLTVHSTSGDQATSSNSINVTILDDDDVGPPQLMMMSFFSSGDELVSNDDALSSNFMTVSNGDASELVFATVTNEDPSSVNDPSSNSNDETSSTDQESSSTGSDQALTNEMVFSTETQNDSAQAEQQTTLDGNNQPSQEVAQQQQEQQDSNESPAAAPDAISQSTQEADQQTQQQSGSG